MKTAFISYSSQDKAFVRQLASDLATNGIRTWIGESEIRVGDSLIEKIVEGINQSDFIIAVLSKSSIHSKWVEQELKSGFMKDPTGAKRVLIPIVLEKVEIPPFLRNIKYADLTRTSYQDALNEIIKTIQDLPSEKLASPGQFLNANDLAKEVAKEVAQILKTNPNGIREEGTQHWKIDPDLVFVIMSFSSDMEPIFDGIKAAGEHNKLRVERVKDVKGDYRITDKVFEMMHKARFIVADLTHERPNVYFELGFARGIGKTILTIAREGAKLHFDVKDWKCNFYTDSRVLERDLKDAFASELGRA
jgi:nucleoside 2-deoxyribosyltransferase